jgi:hypothetical protein
MGGTEEDQFRGQMAGLMQQTQQSPVKPCHPVPHTGAHCRCPIQARQQSAGALGVKDQGALGDGRRASCLISP